MAADFVSMIEFGLERAADVLTRGFADYFVRIPCTAAGLLEMARADSVDLAASCIVLRDGKAVGAGLIARRGWTSRLAGMALVPEARRHGLGRGLVNHLLAEATTRAERTMVLEVIEQNEPAVKLYEACGFRKVRRLVGFSAKPVDTGAPLADLTETDLREVGAAITAHGLRDLPWQLSGETVANLGAPAVGYQRQGVWVALSNPAAPQVAIRGLATAPGAQSPERTLALLHAVMAKHPTREWRISALWPEEISDVFLAAGFARTALSQWQMARELP